MKKIEIVFQGGQSRYGTEGVDFMLSVGSDTELYAEVNPEDFLTDAERGEWEAEQAEESDGGRPADWCRFEDMVENRVYDALKAKILEQAAELGIPAERLTFAWD